MSNLELVLKSLKIVISAAIVMAIFIGLMCIAPFITFCCMIFFGFVFIIYLLLKSYYRVE